MFRDPCSGVGLGSNLFISLSSLRLVNRLTRHARSKSVSQGAVNAFVDLRQLEWLEKNRPPVTRCAGTRDVNLKSKDGARQENRVYLFDITVTSEGFPDIDSSNSEGISMHRKGGLSKRFF